MNIKQSYFDFLNANGAKEKIENVITAQIEEWKQQPYYEYEAGEDEFGDRSGRVNRIQGKTIGDMCDTYGKVLTAYSGNSEATCVSHCGLSYNSVAKEISDDINDEFVSFYTTWIKQNREEIFAELGIDDYDETWDDQDMYIAVREHCDMVDDMNDEWFCQNIRQYFIGEDGQPTDNENDLVFWIRD